MGPLEGGLELPPRVDFGDVSIGASASRSVELLNHGSEELQVLVLRNSETPETTAIHGASALLEGGENTSPVDDPKRPSLPRDVPSSARPRGLG